MRSDEGKGFLANDLDLAPDAFVAPGAVVVGRVRLGSEASVWYGCVLRGDIEPITIGERTNIQDGTVVHVDDDLPTIVGARVTVGHKALVHGCEVGDDALIGMGAVVLSGAKIGPQALVAAGAVVKEGFEVPPRTMVAGVPAKVRGELDDDALERMRLNNEHYVAYARAYREGRLGGGRHGGR
jgi:carbonic anhydrase/acetyltransferase-like protein (isoleucine patch superfamily)